MALLQRKNKIPLGIYIHVPFCRSKCQYCDFYSLTSKKDCDFDGYLEAVCQHIKEAGPQAPNHIVDTVYFGGGTPSFFGADGMAAILTAIRKSFDVSPSAEITFEANPDSVTDRLLREFRPVHSCGDDPVFWVFSAIMTKFSKNWVVPTAMNRPFRR